MHLASNNPPVLATNGGGNVIVDASVTSPDSINQGPGSGTYDATATANGVIIAHNVRPGGVVTYLMQSLLLP
jgi:hypothetical protein